MPTADRRRFVPWAITYFQRQDYPNRELVIVDDGRDPVADLVPSDDTTIRYVRLEERLVTGAKRNRACRESVGDIIVHWDDDDWFAPWRIRYQVDELLRTGADLCGLSELFFLDLDRDHGWRYRYPPQSKRPWVAGGTMAYRRSLWERRPFPEVRQGEDTRFLWKQNTDGIAVLDRSDFYVATIHRANTSRKQTANRRWTPVPAATILDLMGDDQRRYRSRSPVPSNHGRAMAGPAPSSPTGSASSEASAPAAGAVSPVAAISGPTSTVDHRVVVSIPHFGPARYLRAAVDSILAQTHRNLIVVVVFDGDPSGLEALGDITDQRLVRFELPVNRGRYFADQIVLEAVAAADPDCRFFVVQDSDDWSDRNRIERLVRVALDDDAEVCLSSSLQHDQRRHRDRITRARSRLEEPVTAELVHRIGHQGLYRVEALQRLGGWYAGYRIGFDTSIVNLLLMTGTKISYIDEPLYHRRIHGGSLTNSAAFGWGSPVRTEVVAQLRSLHRAAYRMATTAPDHRQASERIRALVRKGWSSDDERALGAEAARLARELKEPTASSGPPTPTVGRSPVETPPVKTPPVEPHDCRIPDVYSLIDRGVVDGRDWSVSVRGAVEIYEHILRRRPRRLLDVGSGISTLVAAVAAARVGARVVSLEHDARFAARTEKLLSDHGVSDLVTLQTAPLKLVTVGDTEAPWYDFPLEGKFDFIIVDGPPLPKGGREAVLPMVAAHRRRGWEIWLFDGDRDHERRCVERWSGSFRFDARRTALDETGVTVLTPHRRSVSSDGDAAVPDLGISLLAGGRPELLQRTLTALETRWPTQLASAYVLGFVNGPDKRSKQLLGDRPYVDQLIAHDTSVLGIGAATSYAMACLSSQPSVKFVLHIEDDWEAVSVDDDALVDAAVILDDPGIGQVRLRHRSERTLANHMVTKQPIIWEPNAGGYGTAHAHFTFNPSLVRADTIHRIFPAEHELDAQRRFLHTGLRTAQTSPGVFVHTGGPSGGALSRRGQMR